MTSEAAPGDDSDIFFRLTPVNTPPSPLSGGEVIYVGSGDTFTSDQAGIRPVPMMMPEVAGIHVGGCIRFGKGSSLGMANAHAHIGGKDLYSGWICFRSPQTYESTEYAYLIWHEYAHILSKEGHTDKWREIMRQLGQPIAR